MSIQFRVYFIRPTADAAPSLGVHPDDLKRLEHWRDENREEATWLFVTHPITGERLAGLRAIDSKALKSMQRQGIANGQLCQVTYEIETKAGERQMRFVGIVPISEESSRP